MTIVDLGVNQISTLATPKIYYDASIRIYTDIWHGAMKDIHMYVQNPVSSTWYKLVGDNGGYNKGFKVTWDPSSSNVMTNNIPGNQQLGTFKPMQDFTAGLSSPIPAGNWKISITDDSLDHTGTLERWFVEFCEKQDYSYVCVEPASLTPSLPATVAINTAIDHDTESMPYISWTPGAELQVTVDAKFSEGGNAGNTWDLQAELITGTNDQYTLYNAALTNAVAASHSSTASFTLRGTWRSSSSTALTTSYPPGVGPFQPVQSFTSRYYSEIGPWTIKLTRANVASTATINFRLFAFGFMKQDCSLVLTLPDVPTVLTPDPATALVAGVDYVNGATGIDLAVSYDGKNLYLSTPLGKIATYGIYQPTGLLTYVTGADVTHGSAPHVAHHPSLDIVYSVGTKIQVWKRNTGVNDKGKLTLLSQFGTGVYYSATSVILEVIVTARTLYVAVKDGGEGLLVVFSISQYTGAVQAVLETLRTSDHILPIPYVALLTPNEQYMYVAGLNNMTVWSVEKTTGSLTYMYTSNSTGLDDLEYNVNYGPTTTTPTGLPMAPYGCITPDGTGLYIGNEVPNPTYNTPSTMSRISGWIDDGRKAAVFDGIQASYLTFKPFVYNTDKFTFATWIRAYHCGNPFNINGTLFSVISVGYDVEFKLQMNQTYGGTTFVHATYRTHWDAVGVAFPYETCAWNHLAVTWDGSTRTVTYYVNGKHMIANILYQVPATPKMISVLYSIVGGLPDVNGRLENLDEKLNAYLFDPMVWTKSLGEAFITNQMMTQCQNPVQTGLLDIAKPYMHNGTAPWLRMTDLSLACQGEITWYSGVVTNSAPNMHGIVQVIASPDSTKILALQTGASNSILAFTRQTSKTTPYFGQLTYRGEQYNLGGNPFRALITPDTKFLYVATDAHLYKYSFHTFDNALPEITVSPADGATVVPRQNIIFTVDKGDVDFICYTQGTDATTMYTPECNPVPGVTDDLCRIGSMWNTTMPYPTAGNSSTIIRARGCCRDTSEHCWSLAGPVIQHSWTLKYTPCTSCEFQWQWPDGRRLYECRGEGDFIFTEVVWADANGEYLAPTRDCPV